MRDWSKTRLKSWSKTVFGEEPSRIDDYSNIIDDRGDPDNLGGFQFIGSRSLFVGSLTYYVRFSTPIAGGSLWITGEISKRGIQTEDLLGIQRYESASLLPSGEHSFRSYEENAYFTGLHFYLTSPAEIHIWNVRMDGSLLYYPRQLFETYNNSSYPQRFFASSRKTNFFPSPPLPSNNNAS